MKLNLQNLFLKCTIPLILVISNLVLVSCKKESFTPEQQGPLKYFPFGMGLDDFGPYANSGFIAITQAQDAIFGIGFTATNKRVLFKRTDNGPYYTNPQLDVSYYGGPDLFQVKDSSGNQDLILVPSFMDTVLRVFRFSESLMAKKTSVIKLVDDSSGKYWGRYSWNSACSDGNGGYYLLTLFSLFDTFGKPVYEDATYLLHFNAQDVLTQKVRLKGIDIDGWVIRISLNDDKLIMENIQMYNNLTTYLISDLLQGNTNNPVWKKTFRQYPVMTIQGDTLWIAKFDLPDIGAYCRSISVHMLSASTGTVLRETIIQLPAPSKAGSIVLQPRGGSLLLAYSAGVDGQLIEISNNGNITYRKTIFDNVGGVDLLAVKFIKKDIFLYGYGSRTNTHSKNCFELKIPAQ